jgi:hypothetical protein
VRPIIEGKPEPLPARGMLVTTRVHLSTVSVERFPVEGMLVDPSEFIDQPREAPNLLAWNAQQPGGRTRPVAEGELQGAWEFTTGPLREMAQKTVLEHRD